MSTTPNLGITHWTANQGNPDVTGNTALDSHDYAIAGELVKNCAAGGTFTLGSTEWINAVIKLTGAPGAGFNVVVPLANPKLYLVWNATGQTATIKGTTGATVAVAAGVISLIYCDGTDCTQLLTTSAGSTTALSADTDVTLAGTTAGSAVSSQPFRASTYKKVIVFLNGYNNTTGSAQTITFPVAFTQTPVILAQSDPPCTVSTTTLTLPTSMSGPTTGFVILEGK
jgi:hypothetical protein